MNMDWEKKIIQVKDESNLNAMTIVLKFVVSCEYLSLEKSFQSFYFSHGFSKACQHVTIDEKVW
jgi:hypothetical protein